MAIVRPDLSRMAGCGAFTGALKSERGRVEEWCCQTGLNCRPLHYQWSALPLSYGSMPGTKNRPKKAPQGGAILATRSGSAQARGGRSDRAGDEIWRPRLRLAEANRTIAAQVNGSAMKDSENDSGSRSGKTAKDRREARLKQALRENLKRRKSQARERVDFTPSSSGADEVAKRIPDK
jgi:hypothetical protein